MNTQFLVAVNEFTPRILQTNTFFHAEPRRNSGLRRLILDVSRPPTVPDALLYLLLKDEWALLEKL
jgi:hypothetical protein